MIGIDYVVDIKAETVLHSDYLMSGVKGKIEKSIEYSFDLLTEIKDSGGDYSVSLHSSKHELEIEKGDKRILLRKYEREVNAIIQTPFLEVVLLQSNYFGSEIAICEGRYVVFNVPIPIDIEQLFEEAKQLAERKGNNELQMLEDALEKVNNACNSFMLAYSRFERNFAFREYALAAFDILIETCDEVRKQVEQLRSKND